MQSRSKMNLIQKYLICQTFLLNLDNQIIMMTKMQEI